MAAAVLVAGGAALLLWARGAPAPPRDVSGEAAPPAGLPPSAPVPGNHPVLSEDAACRNVGYLCADLSTYERIRIQRWRDVPSPMIVHLPRPPLPDRGWGERLQRAAAAGVRAWNGQPFAILVDERGTRPAHVEVRWVERLDGSKIGLATVAWSHQAGMRVLSLSLVTHTPWGAPMDPGQIRLVAAHEMGHALGLPHSDDARDVMYPTNTATTLTARDYRTVEALHRLQDGTEIVRARRR